MAQEKALKTKVLSFRWKVVFFIGVFLLGSFLRFWQYWEFPVAGETQDEMAWSFLGSSLLQTGQPVSWSYFKGYEVFRVLSVGEGGAQFPLVAPALDHPPLFSLLPGSVMTLLGKSWEIWPSIKLVRFPMIVLAMVNLALFLWWIVRTRLSWGAQVFASVVFATAPSIVFLSRLVVSENLLVTWLLLLLIATTFVRRVPYLVWFGLLAALPLTKMSGGAIGAAFLAWAWQEREEDPRRFWWMLAGLTGGVLAWLLYAAFYDISLFLHIQLQQSQRDTGFLTFFSSQLFAPTLVEKPFADYWVTLGWIGSFVWLGQRLMEKSWRSEERLLFFLFIAQFAFVLLSVGEHTVHGWYRISFLPVFVFFLATFVDSVLIRRSWFGLASGFLLLSFTARTALFSVFGAEAFTWQQTLNRWWVLASGAMVGWEVSGWWKAGQKRLWPVVVVSCMLLVLLSHITTVLTLTKERYWQDELYLEQGLRP